MHLGQPELERQLVPERLHLEQRKVQPLHWAQLIAAPEWQAPEWQAPEWQAPEWQAPERQARR
jgi:hypothetical protein